MAEEKKEAPAPRKPEPPPPVAEKKAAPAGLPPIPPVQVKGADLEAQMIKQHEHIALLTESLQEAKASLDRMISLHNRQMKS